MKEEVILEKLRKDIISNLLLTTREKDVLYYLTMGYSNPEMAQILNISLHTVKFHNKRIIDKLGIDNRNALVHRIDEKAIKQLMTATKKDKRVQGGGDHEKVQGIVLRFGDGAGFWLQRR
jgi:ATP/maltotriose-dependent transcriptional regulator MalT